LGDWVRNYELMLVMDPEIDDERVGAVMDRVRRAVGQDGGEIVSEKSWGRQKLAYKIGRFTEANYHLAQLHIEPTSAKVLENSLNLAEDVVRHILVRQED
jgi:small subunit ribosomal protein S6